MLLANAHAFKATKSADIFLFSYGCDVLFLQSAQNISSTVSNWPAQSYSGVEGRLGVGGWDPVCSTRHT